MLCFGEAFCKKYRGKKGKCRKYLVDLFLWWPQIALDMTFFYHSGKISWYEFTVDMRSYLFNYFKNIIYLKILLYPYIYIYICCLHAFLQKHISNLYVSDVCIFADQGTGLVRSCRGVSAREHLLPLGHRNIHPQASLFSSPRGSLGLPIVCIASGRQSAGPATGLAQERGRHRAILPTSYITHGSFVEAFVHSSF